MAKTGKNNDKKVVHYDAKKGADIKVGRRAMVWPIDHTSPTVSNQTVAVTTPVTSYDEKTGVFETLNSKYVPAKKH